MEYWQVWNVVLHYQKQGPIYVSVMVNIKTLTIITFYRDKTIILNLQNTRDLV